MKYIFLHLPNWKSCGIDSSIVTCLACLNLLKYVLITHQIHIRIDNLDEKYLLKEEYTKTNNYFHIHFPHLSILAHAHTIE
jgi:hypothetical protein